jgi:class 3 adenylate cyclase
MIEASAKSSRVRGTRLQVSIATIFALLILPALAIVIAFSYYKNARNLENISQSLMDRARDEAVTSVSALLDPVVSTLRVIAAVEAARPGYFREDSSGDVLYQSLLTANYIDAVYTSFEDGYHRVVTRIDEDRRRSDPKIPATANWHMSWIDPYRQPTSVPRVRHRSFFETWPTPIVKYDAEQTFDVRTMVQYREARSRRTAAITAPIINPDTGAPVIAIGYPIEVGGLVVGVVTAHITLGVLSKFLDEHRASPNSITVISHKLGSVIAHPVAGKGVRLVNGRAQVAMMKDLDEPQIVTAVREREQRQLDRFTFEAGPAGTEYVALFSSIPGSMAWQWEVLVVAPTDDFVGELKRTNRLLIWAAVLVVLLESVLIYFMARKISAPIEAVSKTIQRVRSLSFGGDIPSGSRVREIAQLQRATKLLDNALRSFALFAPVGIVRDLIESGRPLTPGMEQRFVTVLFSDVENFTNIAEQLSPQELSQQTSRYFENVTSAIAEEGGTIDKFIGDSVMAFWGAPAAVDDHVFHACAAALRASRRMKRLNVQWAGEGRKQMRVRIGVHCDDVVVGNVGSPERLSYTVMGDGVNVASRIEGLNKQFGTSICISENVHERVAGRVVDRALGRLPVKGRAAEIVVYELLGIAGSNDPELSAGGATA